MPNLWQSPFQGLQGWTPYNQYGQGINASNGPWGSGVAVPNPYYTKGPTYTKGLLSSAPIPTDTTSQTSDSTNLLSDEDVAYINETFFDPVTTVLGEGFDDLGTGIGDLGTGIGDLGTDITGIGTDITGAIDDLSGEDGALTGILEGQADLGTDITGIGTDITGAIDALSDEGGALTGILEGQTDITGAIDALSDEGGALTNISGAIDALSDEGGALTGILEGQTDITGAIDALSDEDGALTNISGAIGALSDEDGVLTNISGAIDALSDEGGALTNISGAIDTLSGEDGALTNISGAIDALSGEDGALTVISSAIDALSGEDGALTNISGAIDTLSGEDGALTNISGAIDALSGEDGALTVISGAIDALSGEDGALTGILKGQTDITDSLGNVVTLEDIEGAIGTLSGEDGALTVISGAIDDLSGEDGALTVISSAIDDLSGEDGALTNILEGQTDLGTDITDSFGNVVTLEEIEGAINDLSGEDGALTVISSAIDDLSGEDGALTVISSAIDDLSGEDGALTNILEGQTDLGTDITDALDIVGSDILEGQTDLGTDITDSLGNVVTSEDIKNIFNDINTETEPESDSTLNVGGQGEGIDADFGLTETETEPESDSTLNVGGQGEGIDADFGLTETETETEADKYQTGKMTDAFKDHSSFVRRTIVQNMVKHWNNEASEAGIPDDVWEKWKSESKDSSYMWYGYGDSKIGGINFEKAFDEAIAEHQKNQTINSATEVVNNVINSSSTLNVGGQGEGIDANFGLTEPESDTQSQIVTSLDDDYITGGNQTSVIDNKMTEDYEGLFLDDSGPEIDPVTSDTIFYDPLTEGLGSASGLITTTDTEYNDNKWTPDNTTGDQTTTNVGGQGEGTGSGTGDAGLLGDEDKIFAEFNEILGEDEDDYYNDKYKIGDSFTVSLQSSVTDNKDGVDSNRYTHEEMVEKWGERYNWGLGDFAKHFLKKGEDYVKGAYEKVLSTIAATGGGGGTDVDLGIFGATTGYADNFTYNLKPADVLALALSFEYPDEIKTKDSSGNELSLVETHTDEGDESVELYTPTPAEIEDLPSFGDYNQNYTDYTNDYFGPGFDEGEILFEPYVEPEETYTPPVETYIPSPAEIEDLPSFSNYNQNYTDYTNDYFGGGIW